MSKEPSLQVVLDTLSEYIKITETDSNSLAKIGICKPVDKRQKTMSSRLFKESGACHLLDTGQFKGYNIKDMTHTNNMSFLQDIWGIHVP